MSEQLPAQLTSEEQELIELAKLNKGFERDELTVPFLKLLQPLSPYVQDGNPQYAAGARPGMFFNTASGQLNDGKTGIVTCVITHQKSYTQWVPRGLGGGLVKDWGDDEGWQSLCETDQKHAFQPVTREGHSIVKARSFTIFNINPATGAYDPSIMLFSSTNLKAANAWSTMLNQDFVTLSNGKRALVPHYYYAYLLNSELTTNNKGSWYSARVRQYFQDNKRVRVKDLPNGEEIWQAAVNFQKSLAEGTIKSASMDVTDTAANDDEVPF